MIQDSGSIEHVSDTALWVAYYRAEETKRPDALFRDPYAAVLMGAKGPQIAERLREPNSHTRINVLMRTVIIDEYLAELTRAGVDTVLNLGAGLDTRPYRLSLPANLRWIEVDYPHMIEMKSARLSHEIPHVRLEQVPMDLADQDARRSLFRKIDSESQKVAVLTEGLLPYLTPEQVSSLSDDLKAQTHFEFWIAEYLSPAVYKYLQTPKRLHEMRNAPFQFFPSDWFGFFKERGWKIQQIRYVQEAAFERRRNEPLPWWVLFVRPFISKKKIETFMKSSGYMILSR